MLVFGTARPPGGERSPAKSLRSAAVRRALVLIVILLATLALVACGKDEGLSGDDDASKPAPSAVATESAAPTKTSTTPAPKRSTRDGCEAVAPPEPAADPERRPSRRRLNRKRRHTVVIDTNCGTIEIRLDVRRAPKTTAAFAGLVRRGFFDGLTFHRIAKPGGNDYVIQGGDPLGTGNGGPGYSVVEPPPKNLRYTRYTVAMAKTQTEQPGTSGSQFFIVTAPEAPLPPEYALLGEVVGGKSVVNRIAQVPTDPATEMPLDPVVMTSVRLRSSGG